MTRVQVQALYERFPYPTPQTDLTPFLNGQILELGFPRLFFHKYWPHSRYTEELDILIAGCGSSQAARYAAAHPMASVTGIDLSQTSLDTTKRLADQHGLTNLVLRRMAVEEAGDLEQRFDLIVSTGVIHHLPEPAAGLRALRQVLAPQGVIYLMVYAPYGRDAIYYLQRLLSELGITADNTSDIEVELLRQLVDELPRSHPLWQRRRQFPDLRNTAELVDYLLHPQDRPFTIGECYELLEDCGFALQDVFNRAHYQLPENGAIGDLLYPRWHTLDERARLELGELYRAALTRHDIIVCRDDKPLDKRKLGLDCGWDDLIPIAAPGLSESSEGVPYGKVVNLHWAGHAFRDIRLSVDQDELAVVRAMDGESSLSEIREAVMPNRAAKDDEYLGRFLNTLRDYDFVWFKKP